MASNKNPKLSSQRGQITSFFLKRENSDKVVEDEMADISAENVGEVGAPLSEENKDYFDDREKQLLIDGEGASNPKSSDFTVGFFVKRDGKNYKFDWCVCSNVTMHFSTKKEDDKEGKKLKKNHRQSFCSVCWRYVKDHSGNGGITRGECWSFCRPRQLENRKLMKHEDSSDHRRAQEYVDQMSTRRCTATAPTKIDDIVYHEVRMMTQNIGNALFVAKNNCAINTYTNLCQHSHDQGVDIYKDKCELGRHTAGVGRGLLKAIELVTREERKQEMQRAGLYSLFYDESENTSHEETLNIHIRFMQENGEARTEFLDLSRVRGHKEGVVIAEKVFDKLTELGKNELEIH